MTSKTSTTGTNNSSFNQQNRGRGQIPRSYPSVHYDSVFLKNFYLCVIGIWLIVMALFPRTNLPGIAYYIMHYLSIPFFFGLLLFHVLRIKNISCLNELNRLVFLSMCLYLLYTIFSVLVTPEHSKHFWLRMISIHRMVVVPFVIYWATRILRLRIEDMLKLLPVVMGLIWIEAIVSFCAWLKPEFLPDFWPGRVKLFGGYRIIGTFLQQDAFACGLIFFMTLLFAYAVDSRDLLKKNLCFVLFNIGCFCIFLSYSRASWLGAACVLAILAVFFKREFFVFVLPSLIFWTLLVNFGFEESKTYAAKRISTWQTIGNRLISNHAGLNMISEKPLLGWGYDTYDEHHSAFVEQWRGFVPSEWDKESSTSHNTFLTILAETGIIGTVFYLFPFFWWAVLAGRYLFKSRKNSVFRKTSNWHSLVLLISNLAFIFIVSQFIDLRFFPLIVGQTFLILGLVANFLERDLQVESVSKDRQR